MICDWCESPMTDIGPETTGMEASAGWHVWLCNKPRCGHERSGKHCAIQPAPALVVDEEHYVAVNSAKWRKEPLRSYAKTFNRATRSKLISTWLLDSRPMTFWERCLVGACMWCDGIASTPWPVGQTNPLLWLED